MKISFKILVVVILILTFNSYKLYASENIKIGLLVPLTGNNQEIGKSIVQSVRLAVNKINDSKIEVIPKDTKGSPEETLKVAKELALENIKIIIGPVFNNNLIYLDELKDILFISLTNKKIKNSKNIISAGINAQSQLSAIKKFQELNDINKTFFLIPNSNFKEEIKNAISSSKVKIKYTHIYDSEPTLLTKQIEKITRYSQRKQNLVDEIKRLENSQETNKENKIENLKKRDTLGGINFDSVIICDFDESLKSVATSLLYTDVPPERIYYITLNQWFNKSLLDETSLQPLYFPSINKKNYDEFVNEYNQIYNEFPNQISFLSYDLFGLVYFLIYQNNFEIDEKIFYKKNKFKGKIGIFEINKNKIHHVLNFYKVDKKQFKKVF